MRYAKVKFVVITGIGNRVFNQGDEVNENNFPVGTFDQLLKQKSIELVKEDEVPAKPPIKDEVEFNYAEEEDVPEGIKQRMESIKLELQSAQISYPNGATLEELSELLKASKEKQIEEVVTAKTDDIDDTTRKEIMLELDGLKVSYPKNASKQELYALWRLHKK